MMNPSADTNGTSSGSESSTAQQRGVATKSGNNSSNNNHTTSDTERYEVIVERAGRRADDDFAHRRPHSRDSENSKNGSPDSSFIRDLDASTAMASSRMGDSRSIVLALRSLQNKIRKLESDRDFHREQCEAARRAHEQYKSEVEARLERDRAEFRVREQELQDLIARAKHEHNRLLRTLEDRKLSDGAAHIDFDELLEKERSEATRREARLREDLERYRRNIADEKLAKERLVQELEHAQAESKIIAATNRRLEQTLGDILAVNDKLVQQRGNVEAQRPSRVGQQLPEAGGRLSRRSSSSDVRPLRQPPMRFQTPTQQQQKTSADHVNQRRHIDPSTVANLSFNRSEDRSPGRRRPPPRPVALHRETHDVFHNVSLPASSRRPLSGDSMTVRPLDEVYAALDGELRELNRRYKAVIAEAGNPSAEVNHDVLTTNLNNLMAQIDRKTEQLRLLRLTRADVSREDLKARPRRLAKGYVKATLKAQGTNGLRALAAPTE